MASTMESGLDVFETQRRANVDVRTATGRSMPGATTASDLGSRADMSVDVTAMLNAKIWSNGHYKNFDIYSGCVTFARLNSWLWLTSRYHLKYSVSRFEIWNFCYQVSRPIAGITQLSQLLKRLHSSFCSGMGGSWICARHDQAICLSKGVPRTWRAHI